MYRVTGSRQIRIVGGWIAAASALMIAWGAAPAHAGSGSPVTLGIGAGLGFLHSAQTGASGEATMVNQANLRFKAFGVVGLDYGVDLSNDPDDVAMTDLQYAAKMRLTAMVYPIPIPVFHLYLGGGVGGADLGEVFSFQGDRVSYHVGLGAEVAATDNVVIDASFYVILPGASSVERHVDHMVLSAASDPALAAKYQGREPEIGDFVSANNYELMLRVFLFL